MNLQEVNKILNSNNKVTLDELKKTICELKENCITEAYNGGNSFADVILYNGKSLAFQIVLDLLEHLKV